MDGDGPRRALMHPERLYGRHDLAGRSGLPPKERGLYAWYFSGRIGEVPTEGCHRVGDRHLLYLGIAPSGPASRATLRTRIRQHLSGNFSGSTLRRSLACLLAQTLDLQPRRIGGTGRVRLPAEDERRLSAWMTEHARVVWTVHTEPWRVEEQLIRSLSLPLNLDHNRDHPFHTTLSGLRGAAMAEARRMPVLPRA